jgi:DNA-binding MarR family transcriptional regulator
MIIYAVVDDALSPDFPLSEPSTVRLRRSLAAWLRISKQALNYLLGELERLGSLERRPDFEDLRSKRIGLTLRGIAAVGVIREAVAQVEAEWAEELGLHALLSFVSSWSNSTDWWTRSAQETFPRTGCRRVRFYGRKLVQEVDLLKREHTGAGKRAAAGDRVCVA